MNIENIKEKVKAKLSVKRFEHTLRVEKVAVKLAKINNFCEEKARIAAILHDYMKEEKLEKLKIICKDVKEIKGYENMTEILHGFAAETTISKDFNIIDKEILNAIKYHTIGRKKMSLLEKIIYISDAIEEKRNYPGVKEIREKTFKNLDLGIIEEATRKIKYLKEKNGIVHKNTIEMLDFLEKRG